MSDARRAENCHVPFSPPPPLPVVTWKQIDEYICEKRAERREESVRNFLEKMLARKCYWERSITHVIILLVRYIFFQKQASFLLMIVELTAIVYIEEGGKQYEEEKRSICNTYGEEDTKSRDTKDM